MRITELVVTNWGPYRGEHTLMLPAGPVAVIGQLDRDPERSNWLGKSWLLAAVRWCLYDARPGDAANAEAVVSRGESTCLVRVTLSTGIVVERSRTKGSPKLEVQNLPGRKGSAVGDEGQAALVGHLGMTLEEFDSGLWVGQKASARLVLIGPAARAELVESWLGLERLRIAEKSADAHAKKAIQERASLLGSVEAVKQALPAPLDIEALRKSRERRDQDTSTLKFLDTALLAKQRRELLADDVDRFNELNTEGVALAAKIKRVDEAALATRTTTAWQNYAAATNDVNVADAELQRLQEMVVGTGWDGKCPVMCSKCPVADTVRDRGRKLGPEVAKARRDLEQKRIQETSAQEVYDKLAQEGAQLDRDGVRLEELRNQANALAPKVDEFEALVETAEVEDTREQLRESIRLAEQVITQHETTQRNIDVGNHRMDAMRASAELRDGEARAWLGAAQVLRTTRRELAESASAAIEAGANKLLSDAGIELSVMFRWAREGTGLATNCDRCGDGYPNGQAVKVCARCGAPRPAKLVERLDFVPSHRSGAADDLSGLAVQLAAVAYLRASRGSDFGTVFVDEPLAHMDAANARAFSLRLQVALTDLGFEQALVVAHAPGLMAGFPAKVMVRSDGRWSRAMMES